MKQNKGFTLIELLVAMSIIALISSVIFASLSTARKKARDSQRIQSARQIALALEQYEHTNDTYKVSGAGLTTNPGTGYAAKTGDGYSTSILSALKADGYMSSDSLIDPVFGLDNFYIGLCTSTNAYNVFVKLEQEEYNKATSTIANSCGGQEAASEGFSFIGATTGGTASGLTGGSEGGGLVGAYEVGMIPTGSGGETGGGGGSYIAAIGSLDTSFDIGSGANSNVFAISTLSDSKILLGGNLTTYNGTTRYFVARLNQDGTLDTTYNPGNGANGTVFETAIQADGKILIGGSFTTYNGTSRNRIARLNSDGSLDTTFNPGSGAGSTVNTIAIQSDGKVLIGGGFTSYNGATTTRIARLNSDGSLDTTFSSGSGANSTVQIMLLQPDGKILIGGSFLTYNGISRKYIARLNSDGSLDTTFNPGTGASSDVRAIAIQSDSKIFIGGTFTSYNGTTINRVARLNLDGSLDATFNPGSGADNFVFAALIQPDNKIIIGGYFTSYNGVSRNRIARLNSDGSLDTTFNPGSGVNLEIREVAIQSDGKILIGGAFTSYNGVLKNRIVRIL